VLFCSGYVFSSYLRWLDVVFRGFVSAQHGDLGCFVEFVSCIPCKVLIFHQVGSCVSWVPKPFKYFDPGTCQIPKKIPIFKVAVLGNTTAWDVSVHSDA